MIGSRTLLRSGFLVIICFWMLVPIGVASEKRKTPKTVDEIYDGYTPVFSKGQPRDLIKFSIQPTFYNKAMVPRDSRVDALIRQGMKRESEGEFEEAASFYQKIIEKYPDSLIRVNEYGIFVPAAVYVQQRLLMFPKKALSYYRTIYDPKAKEIYERARSRFSTQSLYDVINFYLATSYGDNALFELGNRSIDMGHYENAARFFEQILDWCRLSDIDPLELNFRLAYAYKLLNRPDKFEQTLARMKSLKGSAARIQILNRLKPAAGRRKGEFTQKKNSEYLCFSDYTRFEPMKTPLSTEARQWKVDLPLSGKGATDDGPSRGELLPFHRPWVINSSIYYRHYNRVYCRSLITGRQRWVFDLGPGDRDVRRLSLYHRKGATKITTAVLSDQDILIDRDMVFANIRAYDKRESLVALDRVTGAMRWSAGPVNPVAEEDLRTRFDGTPGLGRHAVYAPWIYDEGEGADHLYTSMGMTAFEKSSGRPLWKTELCRLSPTSTTQSRHAIRVISATPLVHRGAIYHVTNAGMVSALEEATGQVLWSMRYPHSWNSARRHQVAFDAHDDVSLGAGAPGIGPHFNNQTPLLVDDRLYVTPVDSDFLLCLDKDTGKLIWSLHMNNGRYLVGLTRDDELILTSTYPSSTRTGDCRIDIIDRNSGKTVWSFVPKYRSTWYGPGGHDAGIRKSMRLLNRPVHTEDDKLYFTTFAAPPWGSGYHGGKLPAYGEWCLSLKERKLLTYRIFYIPNYRMHMEAYMRGLIQDQKNFIDWIDMTQPLDVNCDHEYDPVKRMPFRRHGVYFEVKTRGNMLSVDYDVDALERAVANAKTPRELFTRAELFVLRKKDAEAITVFEACKEQIRAEEKDFRREVDRELYHLYRGEAWKALLAGENDIFFRRVDQMARTATTVDEEIQSILALANAFEKKGDARRGAKCLQNLIRHFADTIVDVPMTALTGQAGRVETLSEAIGIFSEKKPMDLKDEFSLINGAVLKSTPMFFSPVAPLTRDTSLEAEKLAVSRLSLMLRNNPDFKVIFEKMAAEDLERRAPSEKERAIRMYPGTAAARKIMDTLFTRAMAEDPEKSMKQIYTLIDSAVRLGLRVPENLPDSFRLTSVPTVETPPPTRVREEIHPFTDGGSTLRLPLRSRGDNADALNLLFVGGRAKKRLDNKFSIESWDMTSMKKRWEKVNIRLKGKGNEHGFEEIFLYRDRVVTHGKFDVLAFDLLKGELLWRFRLPFSFDLRHADSAGDLLILSGATHTMALETVNGTVLWNVREIGELYHTPYILDGKFVSVRREPFGVTFRRLGTGKLIRFLKMPDLSLDTRHPVLAADISQGATLAGVSSDALPIACRDNLLMVTDGKYYFAVDTEAMKILWKRLIDNNDTMSLPPIRFFINGPNLLVLKRDFTLPSLYMLDSRTGKEKWNKKKVDIVYSIRFSADGKQFFGLGVPRTEAFDVNLMAFDAETGKKTSSWSWTGFIQATDSAILSRFQDNTLAIRAIHGEEMHIVVRKAAEGPGVHHMKMKGVGEYGIAGGKVIQTQGPFLMMMSPEQIMVGAPAEGGAK